MSREAWERSRPCLCYLQRYYPSVKLICWLLYTGPASPPNRDITPAASSLCQKGSTERVEDESLVNICLIFEADRNTVYKRMHEMNLCMIKIMRLKVTQCSTQSERLHYRHCARCKTIYNGVWDAKGNTVQCGKNHRKPFWPSQNYVVYS